MKTHPLKYAALSVFGLWVILQIALMVSFWGAPQMSDSETYLNIARRCAAADSWYPRAADMYTPYIWNPGFINFLIWQIRTFGSAHINAVFNFLFAAGILWETVFLGRRYFGERTGWIALILSCLLYSNWFIVLAAATELPFLFLSLSGVCLCHSKKWYWIALAGLLLGLANWVRPLVVIFIPAILGLFVWERRRFWNYLLLAVPCVCVVLVAGFSAKARTGAFIAQSTTSGLNLMMTANDKAYGGVATSIFSDKTSIAYIENEQSLTYAERDAIWKARAVEWIRAHPWRYAALYVKKIAGLYVEDSWADRPILGNSGLVDAAVAGKVARAAFVKKAALMATKSLVYYVVLLLCAVALVRYWRALASKKILLLSIPVCGTALTCIFCVSPRYHYPFFFVCVLFAAYALASFYAPEKVENTPAA